MKNSAHCIKAVPYQEIIDLRDTLERLASWQEPLTTLENYFSNPNTPINKKQVVKQYYACSKLFQTFNKEFDLLLTSAEKQLHEVSWNQTVSLSTEEALTDSLP
ncbi:hypothetical protein UAY_03089 [Enterococcus moraviensis ATCC BAA-383]|uniref:Uncharacterized protein n=1 Tax=Enterococcus moraviensis ATCC BAA-383 TaxID=1158609 RepID=R2T7E3_9ENTE|nr:hypothetical protein [Enterococcus moraviensis]EOH96179.1 hypothetical protein UAY_03089 [Enterococcus moraviensis ATCC BAA-383]EOT66151.1 hypothetical protein I586_02422 [Enterococcus moraviensis ATCC BAA-383]OJG64437.1 hypothetical protein RV09_GL001866 [Enterococcus moraviensis]